MAASVDPGLMRVLERSRALGLLGPGPVLDHVRHAERLVAVLDRVGVDAIAPRALDLGSGGGVPGLVLAVLRPRWSWVLLDSQQKRTDVLVDAVAELDLGARVQVVRARAEEAARQEDLRASVDLVTARSFGPPAVTAECAAGFLAAGGRLVVSEPPDPDPTRWPASGLAQLALTREDSPATGWALLHARAEPADWLPRANGRPAKRPLW